MSVAKCQNLAKDSQPVVTKVLEPSEDLKNTHTYNEKMVSKSPKRYTSKSLQHLCVPKN
ncbi:unnamed protein product [Ectocarpus sp. CCAP 1310/34]|nr:unnamed protein product [Ectocarpus sp. CCAP 1310/34]